MAKGAMVFLNFWSVPYEEQEQENEEEEEDQSNHVTRLPSRLAESTLRRLVLPASSSVAICSTLFLSVLSTLTLAKFFPPSNIARKLMSMDCVGGTVVKSVLTITIWCSVL